MLWTKEMVFQQNLIEKAYFIAKMSCPTMVWPASSDFWKAPLGSSYEVYGGRKKYSLPQQKPRAYSLCWNYEEIILSFFLSSPNMSSFSETFTDPISGVYNRMYAFCL